VESVSVEDGSENTAVGLGYVDINYDIPILIKDTSLISLSGMTVKPSVANMRLRVGFGTLEYGTSYTLSVPAGAVVGKYGSVPAADFHVSFTTVPKPGGDIPYTPGEPGDYSQSPVTSDPINNAKLLYDYLLSIYGGKTLSGAMAKVAWNTDEAGWIYKWTGKYPAIATFDYIHLPDSPANWIDYSDITPVLDWWNAKGLVGAGWHWIVPTYEGSTSYTYDPSKTDFKPSNVVVDGTWENKVAKADLAKISSYLLLLQDHNIPVIWRPLHEAAGNTYTQWKSGAWFWWGRDGAEAYKALWRFMFDYFRDAGVRNLIWVWVTQTSEPGDSDYEFYPGDDYVDIVGRDIYGDKSNDYIVSSADIESQFETITHMIPHKMAALSEMGSVDNISKQRDAGAEWLYFMPWYDYYNDYTEDYDHLYAGISWWRQSFLDSSVLTRSDLPSALFPDWNK
jgi:mannan endo-1,4-beta-mannosidase